MEHLNSSPTKLYNGSCFKIKTNISSYSVSASSPIWSISRASWLKPSLCQHNQKANQKNACHISYPWTKKWLTQSATQLAKRSINHTTHDGSEHNPSNFSIGSKPFCKIVRVIKFCCLNLPNKVCICSSDPYCINPQCSGWRSSSGCWLQGIQQVVPR
mmetsp:Transcript_12929/g.23243  ORF Transcript_12929/g.23243 Transcript_12929/m.23243 type:complete len:158 (+) Transcript_12929:120-593(+)